MKLCLYRHITSLIASAALLLALSPTVLAQPQIDNVYPTLGLLGEDLDITISGSGFDSSTRVSMYLDSTNAKKSIGMIEAAFATSVTIVENLAYVSDITGLRIVDISSLSAPIEVGALSIGYTNDMVVEGDLVYLLTDSIFRVVDISNPTNPIVISNLALSESASSTESAYSLSVVGNVAYVVGGPVLQTVDIGNPLNPTKIASLNLTDPLSEFDIRDVDIEVNDGLAYVGSFSGFHIVDVSNPAEPVIVFEAGEGGPSRAVSITLNGQRAYLAGYGLGLDVYDISNPSQPIQLARIGAFESVRGAQIVGNLAYLSDGGLRVMDISDLNNPVDLGYVSLGCAPKDIDIEGDIAFLAGCDVEIVDIASPEPPISLDHIPNITDPQDVVIRDGIAFAASGNGFYIYNVISVSEPELLGSYARAVKGVDIEGELAYLLTWDGELIILDISSFSNPTLLASVPMPWLYYRDFQVEVEGDFAYVAGSGGSVSGGNYLALIIIDVSSPTNPIVVQDYPATTGTGLDVVGETVYLSDEAGNFQILDASLPTALQVLGKFQSVNGFFTKKIQVVDSRAYILRLNSLEILDITSPTEISLIAELSLSQSADLTVEGDTIYISDLNDGVVVVDISDEISPTILGNTNVVGNLYELDILGNYAFVAGSDLSIVPLPVVIPAVNFTDGNKLTLTLPSPDRAANYTIRVFNDQGYAEELGGVTFSSELKTFSQSGLETGATVPPPAENAVSKALIIAGGGPYPGNNLWPSTIRSADFAYRALLYQGYTRENIYYLSPDTSNDADGDGELNDVDASATTENLQDAILNWALDPEAPAYEMLVFIVDHGGVSQFRLNETTILTAQQLDLWLDELQQSMPGKLMVVYDACQSGTFIPKLLPPENKERIVITSAADENAFFVNRGGLSFSFQFWTSVLSGGDVLDSWIFGRNMMQNFQSAQLDADGDGIANEKEDRSKIQELIIGRGYIPASDKPLISSVSPAQTLSGSLSATISASGIIDVTGIERVWATLSRPDFDAGDKDNPVLELPEIELTDPDGDNTWIGTYDQFDVIGSYRVTIHALNSNGFYSAPSELFNNTTTVSQLIGLPGPVVIDTDGDGTPDTQDIDDDNDGVLDSEDAFPLVNSSTGNFSSSEDPTFSSQANRLNLPIVELISTGAFGQTHLVLYEEVSFQLAPNCGPTAFEVVGGTEIIDETILEDRDITASTYDSRSGELSIPIVEVTTADVFGGPLVSRYINVVLDFYPECSALAFRLVDAERIY